MNFANHRLGGIPILSSPVVLLLFLSPGLLHLSGCNDDVRLPSEEQLTQFEKAGPRRPRIDMDRLVNARIGGGPHRVMPGEVLELTMPAILQVVTVEEPESSGKLAPYICRVAPDGTIVLPVVGQIRVQDKTLAEVESSVTNAYHPKYTATCPSVFARITEYKTADVSITGAVNKPGIYSLNSDRMSLVALLMEAGGIVDEGAAFIRIVHAEHYSADHREAKTERMSQLGERPVELNRVALSGPLVQAGFNQIDVQLKFRARTASDTRGTLTATHGSAMLLAERLDISNESDRRAFLERLIRTEPRVSTAVVNQRLCALAEVLRPGPGTEDGEEEVGAEDLISVAKLDVGEIGRQASSERLTGTGRWLPTTVGDQRLFAPAVSELGYSSLSGRYPTVNANRGLYQQFGTGHPQPGYAVDERRHEQSPEKEGNTAGQAKSMESGDPKPLILPVEGLNIPFADVALQDGDRVTVEPLREPMITVVGLVNRAGNFPYPPNVEYSLMHALGFAGGLNLAADPRYATVYRLAADGTTVSATFYIAGTAKGEDPTQALNVSLKPYDVVAVEHTPRTRATIFWDRVFRVYISTYVTPDDIFGGD